MKNTILQQQKITQTLGIRVLLAQVFSARYLRSLQRKKNDVDERIETFYLHTTYICTCLLSTLLFNLIDYFQTSEGEIFIP